METNQLLPQIEKTAQEFTSLLVQAKRKGLTVEIHSNLDDSPFQLKIYEEVQRLSFGTHDKRSRAEKVAESFAKFRNENNLKCWTPCYKTDISNEDEQTARDGFSRLLLEAVNNVNESEKLTPKQKAAEENGYRATRKLEKEMEEEGWVKVEKTKLSKCPVTEANNIIHFLIEMKNTLIKEGKVSNETKEMLFGEVDDRLYNLQNLVLHV